MSVEMKLLILCFLVFTKQVHSAKILGVFANPSPSHYILGSALMRGLAEKGHEVTVISLYGEKEPPKNTTYRDIVLSELLEDYNRISEEMNMWEMGNINMFLIFPFMLQMAQNSNEMLMNHSKVQELLNSGETFDVIIFEYLVSALVAHLKSPFIIFSPVGANLLTNILSGNPAPPSYVVDPLFGQSTDMRHMTFSERTINVLFQNYAQFLFHTIGFLKEKQNYNALYPNGPNFYDTIYNTSIFLINSHPSMNQAVPHVPNMIEIGGFHVQPKNTVPKYLQQFLDESKEGVIYFSMGSFLKSTQMPVGKRDIFLKALAKVKQQVIMKWDEDVLPGQPKNFMLGKWLPQQEILAHPNVKLFITHAGLLSTTEVIYHGIPVLAIPVFGDQKLNAQKLANEGFGLFVNFEDISEEILTQKLEEVLQNPKYAETAKRKSIIFHDRQVKPLDTAIYWVEYVIRHRGAPHLRVAGLDLAWYKYMLLDVMAFILLLTLVGVYVAFKSVAMTVGCCLKRKQQKLKKN